jgi:hypothetical protein
LAVDRKHAPHSRFNSRCEGTRIITIYHLEVRPFTDKQIALVETFADQAAIAIENVRLLDELRQRANELGRSVEALTEPSLASVWPFRPPVAVAVAVKSGLMVSMKSSSTNAWGYKGTPPMRRPHASPPPS